MGPGTPLAVLHKYTHKPVATTERRPRPSRPRGGGDADGVAASHSHGLTARQQVGTTAPTISLLSKDEMQHEEPRRAALLYVDCKNSFEGVYKFPSAAYVTVTRVACVLYCTDYTQPRSRRPRRRVVSCPESSPRLFALWRGAVLRSIGGSAHDSTQDSSLSCATLFALERDERARPPHRSEIRPLLVVEMLYPMLKSYWSTSPLRPRHLPHPLAQPSSFVDCCAEAAPGTPLHVAAPFPCGASGRRRP